MSETDSFQPLVSIVMTAYKTPIEYFQKALESAINQTWKNIEIIISDDSPEPLLQAIVGKYEDERIRYRHNSPALGPADNHWTCFQDANSDYVAVLHHDDFWDPSFVDRLMRPLLNDSTISVAFCDHWIVDAQGARSAYETEQNSLIWGRSQLNEGKHERWIDLVACQAIPMVMGAIFLKKLLPKKLPNHVGPAYDFWMTYWLCQEGYAAYYVEDRLSNYRIHPDNLSGQRGVGLSRGVAECWKVISKDARFDTVHSIARKQAAVQFIASARNSWLAGRRYDCSYFGWQSFKIHPTFKGIAAIFLLPLLPHRLKLFQSSSSTI